MNFKEATDQLFKSVSHDDLAKELEVSVAAIRQARLSPEAKAFRNPPPGWESAVLRLAEREIERRQALVKELRRVQKSARL